MSALADVKSYMGFWGWTNGGAPGSVKIGLKGEHLASHGDAHWVADVENACNTIKRIQDRAVGLHQQRTPPTAADDAFFHGTGFEMVMADGTRKRIDPAMVYIKPPEKCSQCGEPADDFGAFQCRCTGR